MAKEFKFQTGRVALATPPKQTLSLTATRLGSVLGMNDWQSAFSAWCEITKLYKRPFVGNKYTEAGNALEPIIIEWCKTYFGSGVQSPKDFYGNSFSLKGMRYNFYPEQHIFGGMWDVKIIDSKGNCIAVIEIKTSGRPQDWVKDVPTEKKAQALMYGHMERAPTTFVVVCFLKEEDYYHPELFVPVEGKNTRVYGFDTEEELLTMDGDSLTIGEAMEYALDWWEAFVVSGISPEYDEKKDAEIMKELRTMRPDESETSTLAGIMLHAEKLHAKIDALKAEAGLDALEKELKAQKDAIKRELLVLFEGEAKTVEIGHWKLAKTVTKSIDKDRLKADGLLDSYETESDRFTLTQVKGDKK